MLSPTMQRLSCAILFAAAVGCGGPPGPSAQSAPSGALGQIISLDLPASTGELVHLPISGAKATVVDFWAPSCVPCSRTVPAIVAKRAEFEASGARLVLVGVLAGEESTALGEQKLASWGVSSPFLIDRDGAGQRTVGITDLPTTIILDQVGALRWVAAQTATADDVVAAARALQ
jgi:thiol-disulfide isomerase/thioredoxin